MGIQEYLNNLLNYELKEIKYRYREKIVSDIKDRMCSLLSKWEDEAFRKTILFVTDEEALFYEPDAPADVKRFVVATIRNSMLEIAASVNCGQFKMQEPLSDKTIKEITANAISYFRQCDFDTLKEETEGMEYTDVYEEPIQKYPLAWDILQKAALMEHAELKFEGSEKTYSLDTEKEFLVKEHRAAICDGFTLEFDDYLREELGKVISGMTDLFYVDCFKMLSRNFEKVLHVLQIILENDRAFVTCNYYISNGVIEKRKKLLRAAHNAGEDLFYNLRNRKGTPAQLRKALQCMTEEAE